MRDTTKEEQVCTKCQVLKQKSEFCLITDSKRGIKKLHSQCKLCRKKKRQENNKAGTLEKKLKREIEKRDQLKFIQENLEVLEETNKICNVCLIEKDIREFSLRTNKGYEKTYRNTVCKLCSHRARNARRNKVRDVARKDFSVTTDCMASIRRDFKHLAKKSKIDIDYSFLTVDWYNLKLEEQNRSCKICQKSVEEVGKRLVVDHCHTTGKVRGLLCSVCNLTIGRLGDDYKGIMIAAQYLFEFENQNDEM